MRKNLSVRGARAGGTLLAGLGAVALLVWLLPAGPFAPSADAGEETSVRIVQPTPTAATRLAQVNPCAAKNPCAGMNPCGAKNPCAGANPCAGKNPCAARNPCGAANPCGGMNPCGANPCGGGKVDASRFEMPAGVSLASGSRTELIAEGKKLWNDPKLGNSGLSCANCHVQDYAMMNPTFAEPYPHYVAMPAQQGGVQEVSAAEMVNFCMIVPMASEPLPWTSQQLAALTAYVESIQPGFRPVSGAGANPCNPCGGSNPCGAGNPCGGR